MGVSCCRTASAMVQRAAAIARQAAGGPTGGAVNNSGTATGGRSPGLSRNYYLGPGLGDVDFRISRTFTFAERYKFSILGEAFNLFNRTNLGTPNAIVFVNNGTAAAPNYQVSPSAGLITTLATTPRQVQFGLKLMF